MEIKILSKLKTFTKSFNFFQQRINHVNTFNNFSNSDESFRSSQDKVKQDPYQFLLGCDIVSLCTKLVVNTMNTFQVSVKKMENDNLVNIEDKSNKIYRIINRPHPWNETTLLELNWKWNLEFLASGVVYMLLNKANNSITILNARYVNEINAISVVSFDRIPKKLIVNIQTEEQTNLTHFELNYENGFYYSLDKKDLFILRIEDKSQPDNMSSNANIRTSSVTSLHYLVNTYLGIQASLYNTVQNGSNSSLIINSKKYGIDKNEVSQQINNYFRGITGLQNHGKTQIMDLDMEKETKPEQFEINTLPKNDTLLLYLKTYRSMILQSFPISIPEQLIDANTAHYNSRDDAGSSFAANVYSFYNNNFIQKLEIFLNKILLNKESGERGYIYINAEKSSNDSLQSKELQKMTLFPNSYTENEKRAILELNPIDKPEYNELPVTFNQLQQNITNSMNQNTEEPISNDNSKSLFNNKQELNEKMQAFLDADKTE